MKVVVAPTDFTPASLNAVQYAVQWALSSKQPLWLIHVCDLPGSFTDIPVPQFEVNRIQESAEKQIKALKDKIISETGNSISVHTEVRMGDVTEQIESFCESVSTAVLVMGAETAGAFARFMGGAATINAVQDLKWTVLVVPPHARFNGIQHIALACDYKEVEKTIPLKEIRQLIEHFNAKLHIVHVSESGSQSQSSELITESIWMQHKIADLHPQYHFLESPDTDKAILEFEEKNQPDLLIIVPKKHPLLGKIFRHSHSKGIVLNSPVPVIAMHHEK